MGILADSVLSYEGKIMGVIPEMMIEWEHQHKGLRNSRLYQICILKNDL
jgi:hypothetical protein